MIKLGEEKHPQVGKKPEKYRKERKIVSEQRGRKRKRERQREKESEKKIKKKEIKERKSVKDEE